MARSTSSSPCRSSTQTWSRPRVPHHVGQRLLRHPEAGDGHVRRQRRPRRLDGEVRHQPGPLHLAIDQPAQGGGQAQVVEHRGPQVQRQVAHLLDGPVHDIEALLLSCPTLGAGRGLEGMQIDADRGERLPDLVVQLASEVATFGLLGHHQLAGERPQSLPSGAHLLEQTGLLDGDRQLAGDIAGAVHMLGREGSREAGPDIEAADELILRDEGHGEVGTHPRRSQQGTQRRGQGPGQDVLRQADLSPPHILQVAECFGRQWCSRRQCGVAVGVGGEDDGLIVRGVKRQGSGPLTGYQATDTAQRGTGDLFRRAGRQDGAVDLLHGLQPLGVLSQRLLYPSPLGDLRL